MAKRPKWRVWEESAMLVGCGRDDGPNPSPRWRQSGQSVATSASKVDPEQVDLDLRSYIPAEPVPDSHFDTLNPITLLPLLPTRPDLICH
jgi:hypothetical protein